MNRISSIAFCLWTLLAPAFAQPVWEAATYPDEMGFTRRMAPMLSRLAAQDFGKRSLASSRCPDTGLPVKMWAVEGETIISPYTGRAYVQGPTGYFGPKSRNAAGEITAFGGDPLKYDLPPVTAQLLLDPGDQRARAFLSIPGNLRQQYHFACKNWARLYPLMGDQLGAEWKRRLYAQVAQYAESRRPSDGDREWLPLSSPHTLVGQKGYLLGGNPQDGGTENHKTMWRTSALLYSQLFPDTAHISGYPVAEAEALTKEMLRDFLKRLLLTGNGEYDSQVYYPHSIEGFLNLYDFSPDEETRLLAKFALDYYFATYGLKTVSGAIAGAQKRGYLPGSKASEMEIMQWAFFDDTGRDMTEVVPTIQQITTSYRPNSVISNLTKKAVPLPFEARMSRPFYHMDHPHAFAEYFYADSGFAMGNVQMTIVDNPNQQMVWSLVAQGEKGPLAFSGGHPMRGSTSGHSPYTQTLQSKGTLLLLTAPTQVQPEVDTELAPHYTQVPRPNLWHLPEGEQGAAFEERNRQKYAAAALHTVEMPDPTSAASIQDFWEQSKGSASSWLYFPRELKPRQIEELIVFEAGNTFVAVRALTPTNYPLAPSDTVVEAMKGSAKKFFQDYALWVFPGEVSGYILETGKKTGYGSAESFAQQIQATTQLHFSQKKTLPRLDYQSLYGERLEMTYRPTGLRCAATINGKRIDWDAYTQGAVYESPYLRIKAGKAWLSDGKEHYSIDFTGDLPVWELH